MSPSPNYDRRPEEVEVFFVILHYTGMRTAEQALSRLCTSKSKVSAHYTIDEDGTIYQHVQEHLRAWHAGRSGWRGLRNLNSYSIGVELVNPGHEFGYRSFPESQIQALEFLLQGIIKRHPIEEDGILGHSDVACARKQDPGELFSWERLAQKGLGVWPKREDTFMSSSLTSLDTEDIASLFQSYGYDLELAGALSFVVAAFQRHFYPENVSGLVEYETVRRLEALVKGMSRK